MHEIAIALVRGKACVSVKTSKQILAVAKNIGRCLCFQSRAQKCGGSPSSFGGRMDHAIKEMPQSQLEGDDACVWL